MRTESRADSGKMIGVDKKLRMSVTILATGVMSVAALAGCSGSTSDTAASPTASTAPTSAAPSPSPTQTTASPSTSTDLCSEEAILAALPQGSEMSRFDCADVAGVQWAAAEVQPGPTVFFLQDADGTWDVSTSDEICGTASAGLPPKLLDYCS